MRRERKTPTGEQIKEVRNKFRTHLVLMKGLGEGTAELYSGFIYKYFRDHQIISLDIQRIEDWVLDLKSKCSYNHVNNTILAIEAFQAFMGNSIRLGRCKKPKGRTKPILGHADIVIFLSSVKNVREKAMVALLAYSGIRCQELCNLRVQDIDFSHAKLIVVNGKNSKSRVVYVSSECIKIVMDYLRLFPRAEESYLFTCIRSGKKYNGWALRKIIRSISDRTPSLRGKRFHPHAFRRSMGTHMLQRGASLLAIQKQYGHSCLPTTLEYLGIEEEWVETEYRKSIPSYA